MKNFTTGAGGTRVFNSIVLIKKKLKLPVQKINNELDM